MTTLGALFYGTGALDMAVSAVTGAELGWLAEADARIARLGDHHHPHTRNLGDVTQVDWRAVEPVDVITGGSPCQDLSQAGRRAGMAPGTRSNLWESMREAIAVLRPSLVVWENVRGATSATAHSSLEHCPRCMGDAGPTPALRALGRVLGDLADLGYDAEWCGLRASDVGAPHARFRLFVAAHPVGGGGVDRWLAQPPAAQGDGVRGQAARRGGEGAAAAADPGGVDHRGPAAEQAQGRGPSGQASGRGRAGAVLPTPRPSDNHGKWAGHHDLRTAVTLLPTPTVDDIGERMTIDRFDDWAADMKIAHGNGNGHGDGLGMALRRLLPTPRADGPGSTSRDYADYLNDIARKDQFGQYASAIARWEALTRPAPPPLVANRRGTMRLNIRFSEWMMGLPEGYVCDVPGVTRETAARALGNAVVPQQAVAALMVLAGFGD